jgi:glutamate-1-semialdehyde aminotransferase
VTIIVDPQLEAVSRARQAVAEAEAHLHRAINDALAACAKEGLSRQEAAKKLGIPARRISRHGTYTRSVGETGRLFAQSFSVVDYNDLDALRSVLARFTAVR